MKKWFCTCLGAFLLFQSGCTHIEINGEQKPESMKLPIHQVTKSEEEMLKEMEEFLSKLELPAKAPPDLKMTEFEVQRNQNVDGEYEDPLTAYVRLSNGSSNLVINAAPEPDARKKPTSFRSQFLDYPEEDDWYGYTGGFKKNQINYEVYYETEPTRKINEDMFIKILHSFSDEHPILQDVRKIDKNLYLSKYQLKQKMRKDLSIKIDVVKPTYTVSNPEFELHLESAVLNSPVTKRNSFRRDRIEVERAIETAKELHLPKIWPGNPAVELNNIRILKEKHFKLEMELMDTKNVEDGLFTLSITDNRKDHEEGYVFGKETATKEETFLVNDQKIDLLRWDDYQEIFFKHNTYYYTLRIGGQLSKEELAQSIQSLTKNHAFQKFWEVDVEELDQTYSLHYETNQPLELDLLIYEEGGKIGKTITLERKGYHLMIPAPS